MTDWQPIETAPKDGTPVLVFYRGELHVATYSPIWHEDNLRWCVAEPVTGPLDAPRRGCVHDIDIQRRGGAFSCPEASGQPTGCLSPNLRSNSHDRPRQAPHRPARRAPPSLLAPARAGRPLLSRGGQQMPFLPPFELACGEKVFRVRVVRDGAGFRGDGEMRRVPFDDWIDSLKEDVIQGEYGYEEGEFTVYPEHWRPMWREGLTPEQAFKRALDAFAEARAEDDRQQAENWARIQAEDARYRAPVDRER